MATQVVTISAPFGAGGSIIGPAVAERLGIPFVDRAIPAAVAKDLAVPLDRALSHDQQLPTGIVRILSKMANSMVPYGTSPGGGITETDEEDVFQAGTEKVINEVAGQTGGVILGRAAAIVLAKHPTALHVRLTGSKAGRLARATGREGVSDAAAVKLMEDTDRARVAYVKHFYKADPHDSRLYHLAIDTTVLSDEVSIDLIITAAQARSSGATVTR
jgi:cytidylate kinase